MEIRIGSARASTGGSRRRRDDDDRPPTKTVQVTGWARWIVPVVVLAAFGAAFLFGGGSDEPSPQQACARWAGVSSRVTNTGRARATVESELRSIEYDAKDSPSLKRLTDEIEYDYRQGTVDMFDKQDLTDACKAYS